MGCQNDFVTSNIISGNNVGMLDLLPHSLVLANKRFTTPNVTVGILGSSELLQSG